MTDIDTIVQDLKDAQWKSNNEIDRLLRYEKLVKFIADDYIELSYDKAQCQRNDWRKRCEKLIKSEYENDR
jgi:hypothetical protein